jgi:hypothetical protein
MRQAEIHSRLMRSMRLARDGPSMTLAAQLVAHGVGDYVLQSHWMAAEKTSRHLPAIAHAMLYGVPFAIIGASPAALGVIVGTHFVIDRWRLARHVVWVKNFLAPRGTNPSWQECKATGYPPDVPPWLSVWLMIAADNVLHVLINAAAIAWLA